MQRTRPDTWTIIQSDMAMTCLTELHYARIQSPEETATLAIDEIAKRIVGSVDLSSEINIERPVPVSKMLLEKCFPKMSALQMLEYDQEDETVTATPATTLQWFVTRPDQPERNQKEVALAAAWTASYLSAGESELYNG
jgi:hypothetical protein